jgi:hypothetical protein
MPDLPDVLDEDINGASIDGSHHCRDQFFFNIARDDPHAGECLDQVSRQLGIAARDDDRRAGVAPGGPPYELAGLEICPCRNRAGVDNADIGLGIEADQGVTQLL